MGNAVLPLNERKCHVSHLPEPLNTVAVEFHQRLANGELNRRLAHHLCHVAPELWLAQELAFLVNDEGATLGLKGWNALLEVQRVDVTLVPPRDTNSVEPIFLELKLVPPDFWMNWHEVYHDLACHPRVPARTAKPPAHFAICFLVEAVSQSIVKRRAGTVEQYRRYIERIPTEPGSFQPIDDLPPLQLMHSSPAFRASWPYPVSRRWPDGYESVVRILWVSAHLEP